MRALLAALVVALLASAGALIELRTRPAPPPAPPPPVLAVEPAPPPPALPPPMVAPVREQVMKAAEEAAPRPRDRGDLDRYLGDLQARARRNHQVTALEVEPGFWAIRQLEDPRDVPDRVAEFSRKMSLLSAEMDGRVVR